jgi:hypothetical protein
MVLLLLDLSIGTGASWRATVYTSLPLLVVPTFSSTEFSGLKYYVSGAQHIAIVMMMPATSLFYHHIDYLMGWQWYVDSSMLESNVLQVIILFIPLLHLQCTYSAHII